MTRIPAETFSPGEFIKDELNERGWSTFELAKRMSGDVALNSCNIGLLIHAPDKAMILDKDTSARLGRAFGVSADFFRNLDCAWRALAGAG